MKGLRKTVIINLDCRLVRDDPVRCRADAEREW